MDGAWFGRHWRVSIRRARVAAGIENLRDNGRLDFQLDGVAR